MIDLPSLTRVDEPALTAVVRREGAGEQEVGPLTGIVALEEPFPVRVDLADLVFTGRWA